MSGKELLRSVRRIKWELRKLEQERTQLWEVAAGKAVAMAGMPSGSGVGQPVERLAIELARLDEESERKRKELAELELRAIRHILPLGHRFRQVLVLRYLEGLSWDQVTREMGYTHPKSVYRVHGWALQAMEKEMITNVTCMRPLTGDTM